MLLIFGKFFVLFIMINGAVSDSILPGDESSPGISSVDDVQSNMPVQSAIRNEYNVSFHLFTRENPQEGYSVYAKEKSIKDSPFDSSDRTVFIVHGYSIELPKWKSAFFDIKDELLIFEDLNVIVVNWTEYNNDDYISQDILTVPIVGSEIAKLIHSLENITGILPQSVYLVGHSLGAHVSGYAGKHVPNLGRITGLDAAGPGYENFPEDRRLTSNDALFVDAIHTSGSLLITNGLGVFRAFADQDYFPNGGTVQPRCSWNAKFFYTDKKEGIVDSIKERITCNHDIAPYYYAESINNCDFVAYKCDSYRNFMRGGCSNSITSRMGFHARPIRNLPQMSKFYLRTTNKSPYCLDAANVGYDMFPAELRLTKTDSIFVDSIHTDGNFNYFKGVGFLRPYADQDFYPNDGKHQPKCKKGAKFQYTSKKYDYVDSGSKEISCNHDLATFYYANSINICQFDAVLCDSFKSYKSGGCSGSTVARMEFHAKPMKTLPDTAKFFLQTTAESPTVVNE